MHVVGTLLGGPCVLAKPSVYGSREATVEYARQRTWTQKRSGWVGHLWNLPWALSQGAWYLNHDLIWKAWTSCQWVTRPNPHAHIFQINYTFFSRNLNMRVQLVTKTSGPEIHMLLTRNASILWENLRSVDSWTEARAGVTLTPFPWRTRVGGDTLLENHN